MDLADLDDAHRALLEGLAHERIGGRYVVERVLGSGGMGLVAAARYPELEQEVAIKFMWPELAADTTLAARFLREAKLAARAKSPHLVRVFDFGRLDSGVPYLVMEMLSGSDLGAELRDHGPMSVEATVDYVLQAAVGLAEIHALGVVHRDLKPANLFLATEAGTRTIKVLDLGLSTQGHGAPKGLTTTGHSFGTPHYMSPEQVRESKAVDARSDVWSLGVILYELLTAAVPFGHGSGSTGEVFGLILHTEPIPPRHHRPDLPQALEAVILRCLRREPSDRFGDLAELAEALRPFTSAASASRPDAVRAALAERRSDPIAPVTPLDPTKRSPGAAAPRRPATTPLPTAPTTPHRGARGLPAQGPQPTLPAPESLARQAFGSKASVAASGGSSLPSRPPGVGKRPWLVAMAAASVLVGAGGTVLLTRAGPTRADARPGVPSAGVSEPAAPVAIEPVGASSSSATSSATAAAGAGSAETRASVAATSPAPPPGAAQRPAAAIAPRPTAVQATPRPSSPSSVLDDLDRK